MVRKSKRQNKFDDFWRERLKAYAQSPEFTHNLTKLKNIFWPTLPQQKPPLRLVVIFCGVPGSGKTTLAKFIAKLHPSIILRADMIYFRWLRHSIKDDYYKAYVYQEALAKFYLQQGYSVILDSNNRTTKNRQAVYQLAQTFNAQPIVIRIKVPPEIAAGRVILKGREKQSFSEKLTGILHFQSQIEEITNKEKRIAQVIEIDGQLPLRNIKHQLKEEFARLALAKNA